MWIILLDTSSSMGDPFSGDNNQELTGRIRVANDQTKWQSAKKAILNEVKSLSSNEQICVISFTSTAEVIFEGRAFRTDDLQVRLENLIPNNGTDIAQALKMTRDYINKTDTNNINVEVISDGLSELKPAQEAAQIVAERAGIIEVILIDPTPEGQEVAKSIAVRGRVTNVVSAGELGQEVNKAAERHIIETTRINEVFAKVSQEQRSVTTAVPTSERLAFTVAYPCLVTATVWNPLIIYLHLQFLENEIKKRLHNLSREVGQTLNSSTTQLWAQRGTWITLKPSVEGINFNPAYQEVAWYEDIQEVSFRFYSNEGLSEKLILGSVEIYIENVLVGQIPISFKVAASNDENLLDKEDNEWSVDSGRMFEKVFASYSHQDSEIVESCAAVYEALGIYMYVDRHSLLAGQEWHPALLKLIEDADVFQLYWSEAARSSKYVEDEYQHALSLRNHKGNYFVRPFYWNRPLSKIPENLSSIHFAYLDFEKIRPTSTSSEEAKSTDKEVAQPPKLSQSDLPKISAKEEREYAKNIQVSVIPLLPGELRETVVKVNQDVAHAVAFLENLTGLRYYPVPTLLVDDYVVRQTRSILKIIDELPELKQAPELKNEIEVWQDILQCLLLEFHVSNVPPLKKSPTDGLPEDTIQMYEDLNISKEALHEIRFIAEWELRRWIKEYLSDFEDVDFHDNQFSESNSIKEPLWELTRDKLFRYGFRKMTSDIGFSQFLKNFFQIMQKIFGYGKKISPNFEWKGSFLIKNPSWDFVQEKIKNLNLTAEMSERYNDKVKLQGPFEDYVKLFKEGSDQLLKAISKFPSHMETANKQVLGQEVFETSTYGIFAPEQATDVDNQLIEWAVQNKISAQSVLPKTNRVLFCTKSFLSKNDDIVSERVLKMLIRCVLVHEHFHAILETGITSEGLLSAAKVNRNDWNKTLALNESLAVWLEIHYVRRHADLLDSEQELSQTLDKLWAYVKSGSYPEWVYGGTERIEAIFNKDGITAIHKLINQLRSNPIQAQEYFESYKNY